MTRFLLKLVAASFCLLISDYLLDCLHITSFSLALSAGFLLSLFHFTIRPAFKMLFGLFNLFTLGIFQAVLDVGLIYLITQLFPNDIKYQSMICLYLTSFVINMYKWLVSFVFRRK